MERRPRVEDPRAAQKRERGRTVMACLATHAGDVTPALQLLVLRL